ncbi:MAG: YbaN family protein [Candidatus Marinimicrobia bacterium]|nr:YbaN family protein [Candidatus Neomarinimicrobiota bacterium]
MKPLQKHNNTNETRISSNLVLRIVLVVLGFIFLIIGIIGIILPVLPTTPFIILAAACFARSSQKFYDRLYGNHFFGKILRNYRDKKGLALKYKIYILTMLWLTLTSSAIFFTNSIIVRIILFSIAIAVTIHISRFKTLRSIEN